MSCKPADDFCWNEIDRQTYDALTDAEKYQTLIGWAEKARGKNPNAFDALTEWILDDSEWTEDKLTENERILTQGVFARFKGQNAQLRACLRELTPSGVVNQTVFGALDRFDDELSGNTHADELREAVSEVFADFSVMKNRGVRERIAGNKTGPFGVNSVEFFGYINNLKDCDASVQWALFMPDVVQRQQNGFRVDSFECRVMPAMRFIGLEANRVEDITSRKTVFHALDGLRACQSGFDSDVFLIHHYGLGVDVDEGHGFWGRFMKADTPVPEGLVSFDFLPNRTSQAGPPYLSQFVYATFSGDPDAMHKTEGYDSDAMYDVTRNIMLGNGINIPYPDKYWTAEVFVNGCENYSTAYMFSAEL